MHPFRSVKRLWQSPERHDSLKILAAGYALLIAGATFSGATDTSIARAGTWVVLAAVVAIFVGVLHYSRYSRQLRQWTQSGGEPEASESTGDYKPNFGVAKLPRPGDAEAVIHFAHESIEPALFYRPEQLRDFIQVNPGALRCIRTNKSRPTQITGYYVLLALSERGEGLVLDGAIDVGVAMPAAVTVNNPVNSTAFYIGMYQGLTTMGKGEITFAITAHLSQLAREAGQPIRLYARSGNPSSRKMMDELNFAPIDHDGVQLTIEATSISPGHLEDRIRRNRELQAAFAQRAARHGGPSA